ncbi:MAG: aminoglycoside phosphotransferase family protein [Defluviitaleaceae bacterium]|nr:aminoglycoside phosphotransferase family protein [Defluviitaleaceae bacterium]
MNDEVKGLCAENIIATRPNKTIYRDGNRCIKLFHDGACKASVLNEALNQARVEETGILVPKILEVTKLNGCWAIISEHIEGETLSSLMREHSDKKEEYLNLMVDIQLEIHAQHCPLLTSHRDKMFRKIALTDYDPMTKYELQTHLNAMPRHSKVCHGDFRPSNIIVTPEGKHYVIDWSHVTQGNASADAARTYLVFLLTNRREDAETYLKIFCKKAETPRYYVEKWLRIVAASQSVKGNKDEYDFLTKFVDVIDFW